MDEESCTMANKENEDRLSLNESVLRSRFVEEEDGERFRGTHTRGQRKTENEYVVKNDENILHLTTRTYDERGEVVQETSKQWELSGDAEHVKESGEPIKVFCQSDHYSGQFFGLGGGGIE